MSEKTAPDAIAKRIKSLRIKNKETQNDLANVLNCHQNNVSKIENGSGLTAENLIKIATHYNVSLDYLCKGEGGIDLLDTLKKYVHYKLARIHGYDETVKTHLIPHIELNNTLYNCLRQITLAQNNSDMPESIRNQWIAEAIAEFENNIIYDNYDHFKSFVLFEETILSENPDIIKLIEKHIIE